MALWPALVGFWLLLAGCTGLESSKALLPLEGYECEEQLALQAEVPSTIDAVTEHINSLPKPLTAPCLVASFKGPLSVHLLASAGSAQPAPRPESPRIFIVKDNLMISLVPEGPARNLVEFGEVVAPMVSVKGELVFPIGEDISLSAPYDTIKMEGLERTNCSTCHSNEYRVTDFGTGEAYASDLVTGLPMHRVSPKGLADLAKTCGGDGDNFRCAMLRFLLLNREVTEVQLPTEPI